MFYTESDFERYREVAKSQLSAKRYIHSANVADAAEELAVCFGADKTKAKIAAILHDIAKEMTPLEQMEILKRYSEFVGYVKISEHGLLHGLTGSIYAKDKLKIKDEGILSAIRYHTTGRSVMSLLEKVIFVADIISIERRYPDVEKVRELAKKNLDAAVLYKLIHHGIIQGSLKLKKPIHSDTLAAYHDILAKGAFRQ